MAGRHGRVPTSFCVVLSCVATGLATEQPPVQGILPNVEEVQKSGRKFIRMAKALSELQQ
jgi:hypothetical protein